MRFRTVEDERVYNALRVEIFLRLGAHLPPVVMNEVLRNLGKIEGLLYGEGIRQGMVVAALAASHGEPLDELPALVAHAAFYAGAATPLVRVEDAKFRAALKMRGFDFDNPAADDPWLDASPLPFAPQTLAEATKLYGPELEPAPARRAPQQERVGDTDAARDFAAMVEKDIEMRVDDATRRELDRLGVDLPDSASADHLMSRDASPAFLDRVRDELQNMLNGGWKPTGWQDLIMSLHLRMQVDAAALDLQLSGDIGRTVLAQVGLFDIAPPSMVMTGEDGSIRFSDNLADFLRGDA